MVVDSTLSKAQIWKLAIRPKTLPAAAAAVLGGWAVAYYLSVFQLLPALACMLVALLMQIGANLANDLFDFYKGADTAERLGPTRVTQSGLLTPRQVIVGMVVVFGLAGLIGLYLLGRAPWAVLLIGLSSVLAALAYTGGPLPYGYHGLGDLMVFIFFGPVAVAGTYYLQAGSLHPLALWTSAPLGLLIVAILVVNNLRDIETDRKTGKRTLAVRLGASGARKQFDLCLLLAYAWAVVLAGLTHSPWLLLPLLSAPLAYKLARQVATTSGRPLNQSLAATGRLTLLFSLLLALGYALARALPWT